MNQPEKVHSDPEIKPPKHNENNYLVESGNAKPESELLPLTPFEAPPNSKPPKPGKKPDKSVPIVEES